MARHGQVLVIGAGGLGCAAGLVLARAGLARVTFLDDDRVESANLHRQILHRTEDTGRPKAESAAAALRRLDPGLDARAIDARLDANNALALLRGHDVVLDGSDNFATKFLVNDACTVAGIPFVHAAAVRWGGQLLAVSPGDPCYRCLFEEPPPRADGYSCAEAGVVGPAVGVIGALQAEAALLLLRAKGSAATPAGLQRRTATLMVYDGLAGTLRSVEFHRNPLCRACGDRPLGRIDPAAYQEAAC